MRKRNLAFIIRVTPAEFELINSKAQNANINRNDYVVGKLLSPQTVIGETLKDALSELKQISKALDPRHAPTATDSEKQALEDAAVLIENIYQEIYLIARKGVT